MKNLFQKQAFPVQVSVCIPGRQVDKRGVF